MVVSNKITFEEVVGYQYGYHPFAKPKLSVYLYYIDGLLIDTGQKHARKEVLNALQKHPIDQVFLTHFHEDHTGNVAPIIDKHQCSVIASEKCSRIMKDPPKISPAQILTWGNREAIDNITPVKDAIDTENYHFQLIPIPGHTPDMVALYEPNRQWLFSGDLFVNHYLGYFLGDESILEQMASINRVLKLKFKAMFCSHNPQLDQPKEALKRKLQFYESSFNDIQKLYTKGYTNREIFKALNYKEYHFVKFLSGGYLSKMNLIRAVIRDIEGGRVSE